MLDKENKESFWYFDPDAKMMLMRFCEFDGKHDSIENAYMAYVSYNDYDFIQGIQNCWVRKGYKHKLLMKFLIGRDSYMQGQRYPIPYEGMYGMSRDHLVYSLAALCKAGMKNTTAYIGNRVRFMLSPHWGMHMTPMLWLWIKLISGKKIGRLFYLVLLLKIIKNVIGNKIADAITGFGEEWEQHGYVNVDIPKKMRFPLWRFFISLYYPVYALKLIGTMLDVVEQNWMTRLTKKLALKITPRYNYVLRLLFDDMSVPPLEEVLATYRPMTGDRWSAILNPFRNDRWSSMLSSDLIKCNVLDVDYMKAVYREKYYRPMGK